MVQRDELDRSLSSLLDVARYTDYGPNGLQVEGRAEVQRLVSGVTASLALIEAAAALGADALLVHHGLFWRGQDGRVVGWMRARLALLLRHDINLYAYHLPLDAHPTLGNNAQLGRKLHLQADAQFGRQGLGSIADVHSGAEAAHFDGLCDLLRRTLQRAVTAVPGDGRPLRRVAWCTGGAQGEFEAAIAAGADAYITGEISEPQAHLARETGVGFIACGHHASERYGVAALGDHIADLHRLEHSFIDIDNPA